MKCSNLFTFKKTMQSYTITYDCAILKIHEIHIVAYIRTQYKPILKSA